MRKLLFKSGVVFVLVLVSGVPVFAQEGSGRIAVVNLQAALLSTREGKKAVDDLAAKVEPKRKEFAARQAEVSQLEEQLQKSMTVLSDEKRAEVEQKIDAKKKRLARDAQDTDQEIQQEQQTIMQTFGRRMISVIGKYASEKKYALVLSVGNPGSPIIHWTAEDDITKQVAELFDKTPPTSTDR